MFYSTISQIQPVEVVELDIYLKRKYSQGCEERTRGWSKWVSSFGHFVLNNLLLYCHYLSFNKAIFVPVTYVGFYSLSLDPIILVFLLFCCGGNWNTKVFLQWQHCLPFGNSLAEVSSVHQRSSQSLRLDNHGSNSFKLTQTHTHNNLRKPK